MEIANGVVRYRSLYWANARKTVELREHVRSAGGVTQQFAYFGGRVAANATGGPGTLGLEEVSIELDSAGRLYRHLDFRGNVSFVSDESGTLITHYCYSPYGLDAVYGSGADAVRFVGRHEVGALMVLGARMYDPAIGRFLSPDPILQLLNQYGYALGNPVWFTDPDGTEGGSTADVVRDAIAAVFAVVAIFSIGVNTPVILVGLVGVGFAAALAMLAWSIAASINGHGVMGPGPTPSSGCAPSRVGEVPGLGLALVFLLPLQVMLGIVLIRRRKYRSETSESRTGRA